MMQWLMSKMKKRAEFYFQSNQKKSEMVQETFNTIADEQEAE